MEENINSPEGSEEQDRNDTTMPLLHKSTVPLEKVQNHLPFQVIAKLLSKSRIVIELYCVITGQRHVLRQGCQAFCAEGGCQ